jgi:hypothetical protein
VRLIEPQFGNFSADSTVDNCGLSSCGVQGFGAEFVKEYIQKTGFDGAFNVGEFWTDLKCAVQFWPMLLCSARSGCESTCF